MRRLAYIIITLGLLSACGESEEERLRREANATAEQLEAAADRLATVSQADEAGLRQWMQIACGYLKDHNAQLLAIAKKNGDSFIATPHSQYCS